MKTSLKKLRGALHRHDKRDRHRSQSLVQLDELSQASQDMQDMRDCYDSLLSAAAATANSAFEFSESLKEMGECLLEKTALNEDEESGKVLLMMGKVQFEIQKLVDSYRSHIFKTITVPSESLLNELRIVEEMKRQCDEKRSGYEEMVTRYRERGRSRSGSKGESISSQQLEAAREDYDEDANAFVFRMKSLKRGQSRSLLTQAARHHAAQLRFFRKGFGSLETLDPHVKLVTEQQHIDYSFNGLEDDAADDSENDDSDDDDDDEGNIGDGYEAHDDGELSFDYRLSDQGQDVSASRDSMELDSVELTFPQPAKTETLKENRNRNHGGYSLGFSSDLNKISSKSAPLLAEKNSDSAERFREASSIRKLHAYVLPTPTERRHTIFTESAASKGAQTRTGTTGSSFDLWHSSPLDHKSFEKSGNEMSSRPILTTISVKESNDSSTGLPPPLHEGFSSPLLRHTSDSKKVKRQAFSGPLTGNSWRISSASGPIGSTGSHQMFSGSLLRTPLPMPSSSPPKSSSNAFVSSPKISELHELPRPPPNLGAASNNKISNLIGHSAPLGPSSTTRGSAAATSNTSGSTLPAPPQSVSRSYSIPFRGTHGSKLMESPQSNLKMVEDVASPPLTPISLSNS